MHRTAVTALRGTVHCPVGRQLNHRPAVQGRIDKALDQRARLVVFEESGHHLVEAYAPVLGHAFEIVFHRLCRCGSGI